MKCEICGQETRTDRHHIFNGSMRNKSEEYGAVINVCRRCHEQIHKDAELRLRLKALWQRKIMNEYRWTTEEFIQHFYKNYL